MNINCYGDVASDAAAAKKIRMDKLMALSQRIGTGIDTANAAINQAATEGHTGEDLVQVVKERLAAPPETKTPYLMYAALAAGVYMMLK